MNKMKNALILHGTDSSSQANWFPWLKEELEKRSWEVWVPDLPSANEPDISRYNQFIFANREFVFSEKTCLIGHSSGAVAALGLLQSLPENTSIDTCILVSVFENDLGWGNLKRLFETRLAYETISKKAKRFILIHSDNDPYIPLDQPKHINKKLHGDLKVMLGQKHFNLDTNSEYVKFPYLLDLLRDK